MSIDTKNNTSPKTSKRSRKDREKNAASTPEIKITSVLARRAATAVKPSAATPANTRKHGSNPTPAMMPQAQHTDVAPAKTTAGHGKSAPQQTDKDLVLQARKGLGVTQEIFAKMIGVSARSIAGWETGSPLKHEASRRRILEMIRLGSSLRDVMRPEFVSQWLVRPNEELGGYSPLHILERGETDRLWRSVFLLSSGLPV